ncbi:hypothetical protein [Trebonia sp.]|uniref:hypothetical protein n=1 Tax=Trebonia sp. TaxID=2767075 RepID=UPI002629973B|nr:hypothetical protein [Trebonia sp.]
MYVDPVQRLRSARRRLAEPVESMAQTAAQHATELVIDALDVNALLDRTDVNRLLDRVDVERLIARVDVAALLDRVDVNGLADRVDVDALVRRTELGAIIARSSTTMFSEGIDLVRSQAVGLDELLARWVSRLLRRGAYDRRPRAPGPVSPRAGR